MSRDDRPAIVVPGGDTLTYGDLDRRASGFASALLERGAVPGDRVILANGNTPGFFVALFGAWRAGLVAIPVDAGLAEPERETIVAHADPVAIVVDERSAAAFPASRAIAVSERKEGLAPRAKERGSGPDQALLLYTSGTTGVPKAVLHGHTGIRAKLDAIRHRLGLDDTTTSLCLLPTHFGHGLISVCLATLGSGGTLVLCRPFDLSLLQGLCGLIEAHGVTWFSSVPAIVRLLLRYEARRAPPSLRFVTCASAPLFPEEARAFEDRFGVPLLHGYGITEGGSWCAMPSPTGDRDPANVGAPLGCRVRTVDDHGAELPPGETGHLQIAGPSVMRGYWRNPEETARVLGDGWLATGDLGRVDASGRVHLSGRSKDLILRAGANVYPREVEAVVMRHPAVAEAHVLGLPHPILGETVAACVVARQGSAVSPEELGAHCRAHLAPYKCPERFVLVDAIPKTSRGKVRRSELETLLVGGR